MCFYYAIVKTKAATLVKNKIIREEQLSLFQDTYFVNGFEFPLMPVIANDKIGEVQMFHWGLVPPYTNSLDKAREFLGIYNTLNAKAENVFESKMYGKPVMERRCLVLCSGFFEWRHQAVAGKKRKYPFYITLKDESMFVFAGIWEQFTDNTTGEIIKTFSVITTEANELMEIVHNSKKRMPVILEPEKALHWLDANLSKEEIQSLLKPVDAKKMKARPVSKINPFLSDQYNNPGVSAYYQYDELNGLLSSRPDLFESSVDLR